MLLENTINHAILIVFFFGAYSIGRLFFNNILSAIAIGISILLFMIYILFLSIGINLFTVSLIFVIMILLIAICVVNRPLQFGVNLKTLFQYFSFSKLFKLNVVIPSILLLIYFIKCSFPMVDGDSIGHYSNLPKLYISSGNLSSGDFTVHGKEPLLFPSLIAFLAYFGTLDIVTIFNFYLTSLIIFSIYGMCSIANIQDKFCSNSFCLLISIFLANPLMNFIIASGRPYILIAYFSTALLYFIFLNIEQANLKSLFCF